MTAKTLAQCEKETRELLDSALTEQERGNMALRLEFAVNLAASNLYQAELLRDQLVGVEIRKSTAEMHQFLARMEGK